SAGPVTGSEVIAGGILKPGMGVVIPGRRPDVPYTGEEFMNNVRFAITQEPDFIALSFVGTVRDIRDARKILQDENGENIPLIAKIESREAVDHLEDIISGADGIMVARGDLGVELPIEQVPHIQKEIISRCNHQGIPVITATEMLESMAKHSRPTRAEVTDVANAIIDGTDATMLSGETSIGVNPALAVRTMNNIALETEQHLPYLRMLNERAAWHEKSVEGIISYRACFIAEELKSPAIVAFTRSGLTAERVSRCRPRAPVFAITPERSVARRLLLRWGIQPVLADPVRTADELFSLSTWITRQTKTAVPGDQLVIIAGNFAGKEGRTNMIKVQEIPQEPDSPR
ncbi:MAG: pyruvate kinase, partial [Methanospirillum sp.]|nr:pyruvate kinase [Methanospirillum sp.]